MYQTKTDRLIENVIITGICAAFALTFAMFGLMALSGN